MSVKVTLERGVLHVLFVTQRISPSLPLLPAHHTQYLSNVDESLKWQANAEKAVVITWYP